LKVKVQKKHILIGVAAIIVILLLIIANIDVGTGMIREMAPQAAKDAIGADLALGNVSGNPIRGYKLRDVALSKEGEEVLSIKQLDVKPSLFALIGGKVYLNSLVVNEALIDFERTLELVKSFKPSGAGEGLPLGTVEVKSSTVKGPFGVIDLSSIEVKPEATTIKAKIDASYNGLPAKGDAVISLKEGVAIDEMNLKIAQGEISFSGEIMPELNIEGRAENIQVEELKLLWPPLEKQKLAGAFGGTIKLSGKLPDIRGEGDLSFERGMIVGISVERAGSDWRYEENTLDFRNIDADVLSGNVHGSLTMILRTLPPHINLSLEGKNLDVGLLSKEFPQLAGKVSGTVDSVKADISGMAMELSGKVALSASKLSVMNQPLQATNIKANIDKGKRIDIDATSRWNEMPLKATGYVDLPAGPFVSMVVSCQKASIDMIKDLVPSLKDLPAKGDASGEVQIKGSLKDVASLSTSGKVWSDTITLLDQEIKSPTVNFEFKENALDIKSFSALWQKAKFHGAGKVANVTKAPTLDIKGQVEGLNLTNMRQLIPQLKQYELAGTVSSEWHIVGPLSSPDLSLDFNSNSITFSGIAAKGISGSTSLKPLAEDPLFGISAQITASSVGTTAFPLINDLSASIKGEANKINLTEIKGLLLGGNFNATGQIAIKDKQPALSLTASAKGARLSNLQNLGLALPIEGLIDFDAKADGLLPDIIIAAKASSPEITVAGFTLTDAALDAEGPWNSLKIKSFNARAGGGALTGSGNIAYDKALSLNFDVQGNNLDLKEISKKLDEENKLNMQGLVNLRATISYDDKGLMGDGEITSPEAGVYGLKASDIKVPFVMKDGTITSQDMKARFYEGNASGKGSITLSNLKWTTSVSVSEANLDPLVHDLFPMEGHITGKAGLQFDGSGTLGKNLEGNGSFNVGSGKVSDFKMVKVIAAAYGKSTIDYKSIQGRFVLDTMALTLLPGTQAYAPKGDPMYTYFGADGMIKYNGNLDLSCYGNLNVQAINALVGGIKGGILSGGESLKSTLEGILSGFLQGSQTTDFRDVSLKVTGTFESPKISNLEVSRPVTEDASQGLTQDQTDTQSSPEDVIKKTILERIFNKDN
jgi:translocation and assembly module TamB